MTDCQHPGGTAVLNRKELVQAFGPTATAMIPLAPGYVRLQNDSGAPVYISGLECQHYAMVSPSTVEAARAAALPAPTETPVEVPPYPNKRNPPVTAKTSMEELNELFAAARAGKTVDPAEVARTQAAIALEEVAEQGRAERAEAEQARQEQEARDALEGPARAKLIESNENVQALLDTAFQALMNLLDGVDTNAVVHDEVLATLTAGGFTPDEVRRTDGYVTRTLVGDEAFSQHLKAEYLLALLHTLMTTRHLNAFVGVGGRSISKELPPLTQGGPRVSPARVERK